MFRGFMRLTVDKWGSIRPAPEDAQFEVNNTVDSMSTIEYELVPVDGDPQ